MRDEVVRRAQVDGTAWMAWMTETAYPDGRRSMVLLRFDGQVWSVADPLGAGRYRRAGHLDIGGDGTLWAYLESDLESDRSVVPGYLARFADGAWATYDQEAGVRTIHHPDVSHGVLAVGPDGRAWMSDGPCGGLRSFDGTTWTSYPADVCVTDIEPAPDGSVWVVGGVGHGERLTPTAIYRVDGIASRVIPG